MHVHGSTKKWSPYAASKHQPNSTVTDENDASNFTVQPRAIFAKKATDAFMAQFDTIANGPLEMKPNGAMVAGSFDLSLGKVASSTSTDCTMTDISNHESVSQLFVVNHPSLSESQANSDKTAFEKNSLSMQLLVMEQSPGQFADSSSASSASSALNRELVDNVQVLDHLQHKKQSQIDDNTTGRNLKM